MKMRKPFFVVPLVVAGLTGPSLAGYPANNLRRLKAMGLTWRSNGGGALAGTFSTPQAVDFCAVVSANAQPSTTLRFQMGAFDSGAVPFINPAITRYDGLYHSHLELPSPQTTTDFTLTIAHPGMFEASLLILGQKIQPNRYYDRSSMEFGLEDLGAAAIERNGVWNSARGPKLRSVGMTLHSQNEDEWEQKFRPMIEQVGNTEPVYCCFDPEETTYRQNRTYYGTFRQPPAVTSRPKPGVYGGDYQILSLI